ncbi:MAG: hypothetical protein ACLPXZ_26775 [Mycobacterium sp.]
MGDPQIAVPSSAVSGSAGSLLARFSTPVRASAVLPADLDGLLTLHGVGPKAARLPRQARAD